MIQAGFRVARDKGFACILFSARKSRKQNYSIRQCLHWLMQATPWPADRIRIPHIYAKCGPPEWVTRILARDKGFEPLTFWSARDKGFEPLTFWSVAAAEYKSARFPVLFSPLLPGKCGAFSTVTVCKTRASTARMGQCLGQESVFHNIPHVKFT